MVAYDVLRAQSPLGFLDADCLKSNDAADTVAADSTLPAAGTSRFYLVRAGNGCPGGIPVLASTSTMVTALSDRPVASETVSVTV